MLQLDPSRLRMQSHRQVSVFLIIAFPSTPERLHAVIGNVNLKYVLTDRDHSYTIISVPGTSGYKDELSIEKLKSGL